MSQPNTPEQPDTESQKTAVPQPEMQPETPPETAPPQPEMQPEPLPETPPPQPETPEPAQWQPEKHRFGSIAILVATVAGALLALYACRRSASARFTPTTPMCAAA